MYEVPLYAGLFLCRVLEILFTSCITTSKLLLRRSVQRSAQHGATAL